MEFWLYMVELSCRLTLGPRLKLGDGQGKGVQMYVLLWSGHSVRF